MTALCVKVAKLTPHNTFVVHLLDLNIDLPTVNGHAKNKKDILA